jgi:glycosyltransferase involved in cell wall biosynthesis
VTRTVDMLVPAGFGDATRPSGGNSYDLRVSQGLTELGWQVRHHEVPGCWPWPDTAARRELHDAVARIADGCVLLVDGLIGSVLPEVLVPAAGRLRLVVLVHMPVGQMPIAAAIGDAHARESAVLSAAAAIITTSAWTRARLTEEYRLPPGRVHVAHPGVDSAAVASGTVDGGRLLCVAAVTAHKGHDTLMTALARTVDLPWHCTCVGPLDRDPAFVARLRARLDGWDIADRVRFAGVLTGSALADAYAAADLVVLASRTEAYGMVLTEALARGLPVVATDVGGVPEAVGTVGDGSRPGLLVAPGDAAGLAEGLARWLREEPLRHLLRRAARDRRAMLPGWSATSERVATVLAGLDR